MVVQVLLQTSPARIIDALINILAAGGSGPTGLTAAGEATGHLSARAAVEARAGGTLGHVLLAGGSLPARCTGAGEVRPTVGAVAMDTLRARAPIDLCASSGCAASVAWQAGTTGCTRSISNTLRGGWTGQGGTRVGSLLTVGATEARLALAGDAVPGENTDTARLAGVGCGAQARVSIPRNWLLLHKSSYMGQVGHSIFTCMELMAIALMGLFAQVDPARSGGHWQRKPPGWGRHRPGPQGEPAQWLSSF